MKQSEGESAMEFLRRVVSVLNSEYETHLNDLPLAADVNVAG